MKKRTITALILFGISVGYFVTRMILTDQANEVADAFFAEFSVNESDAIRHHLHQIEQTDHLSIVERHRVALRNFTYKNSTPSLNFKLDKATVSVSWHLTIMMRRGPSGWQIVFLDEYIPQAR